MHKRPRPNIVSNIEDFRLVRDSLVPNAVNAVSTEDAGLVASFLLDNPNTVFHAGSGISPESYPGLFAAQENLLALESVRFETNPKGNEPDLNINRYVFGPSPDGRQCYGFDVTVYEPSPSNGQVGNHWSDWHEVDDCYPTKPELRREDL